jgi:membrane protease YdiL (CAAX protease family)
VSQQSESVPISVPWTGFDVLMFLGVWFFAQILCAEFVYQMLPQEQTVSSTPDEQEHHGHPLMQMVAQGFHSPLVLLVAFFTAVVAAPLVEEFLFRLLLQGWLEATFSRYRVPCGSGVAIVSASLLFAFIHAGSSGESTWQELLYVLSAIAVTSLLIFTLGIVYLVKMRNATLTHTLFGTERFFFFFFLSSAGWCLLALVFIFCLTVLLNVFYPGINTDPIPIFFFSLLLGTLYSRTRNLSYTILLHACLNLTSLILLCLGSAYAPSG